MSDYFNAETVPIVMMPIVKKRMNYQKSLSDLQFKIARTILIVSAILFVPIISFDFSLGFYYIGLLKMPAFGIFVYGYYRLVKFGYQENYNHVVNISVLAFIFLNYFGNQGTNGPSLYSSTAMFVVYPILFSKKWKWVYAFGTVCLGIMIMYFGMDKNNLILPEYSSPLQQFIDHAASYAIIGIYVFVLVGMVLDFYKKQNLDLAIMQEQLNEQVELVQKENHRKENLLGILAHDVKNPINNLRQLCELYQDGMVSEQKLKELMKAMQVRIEDLQGTIDGILGQLNTEIKQEIANEGMGSPVVTTEKVLRLLQYKLDSKNQNAQFLHPEASDISGTIEKKSNEVSIILKNLIDNAYKYSPIGGLVTIRLMEVEKQLIWEVEDEGAGISADKQKQLFKNTLSSDEGSGMGLYLCQSIAESIGAMISYQPKSKGSIFRLSVNL